MLRIKPLGKYAKDGGKARVDYLLDQTIPSSADYYLNGDGEPAGRWFGKATMELGLDGPVLPNQLHGLMQGYDPRSFSPGKEDNEGLILQPGPDVRSGYDCNFTCQKSVSIAYALETPERKELIRQVFNDAVDAALKRLEQEIVCRRGKEGKETEPIEGLFVSVFEHTTARIPDMKDLSGLGHIAHLLDGTADPHLHAHAIVSNVCMRKDGSYGTIVNDSMFDKQKLLGAIFRAEMCKGLRERLGYGIVPGKSGMFEIEGIDEKTIEHFSKRYVVIQEWIKAHKDELVAKGITGRRAEEYAWARTRKAKDETNRPALFEEWEKDARSNLGFDSRRMESLRRGGISRFLSSFKETPDETIVARVAKDQSTFPLSRLEEELVKESQFRDFDVKERLSRILASKDIVVMKDRHGRLHCATTELFEMERFVAKATVDGRRDGTHRTAAGRTSAVIDAFAAASREKAGREGWKFDEKVWAKQRRAIEELTTATGRIAVMKGYAGAGKTTVMTCVRQVYEAHGYEMIGCALAGKAAENLQKEAGIKSDTIAGLLAKIEHGSLTLSAKNVVVIDEAGMVDSRLMHALVKACGEAGAKLVTLGEAEQLQPIGAGGIFRMMETLLAERRNDGAGVQVLDEITRQKDKWLTDIVLDLRRGEGDRAMESMKEHDLVRIRDDRESVVAGMVQDWFAAADSKGKSIRYEKKLMIAGTRAETQELNAQARELRRKAGELKGKDVEIDVRPGEGAAKVSRRFAVGDRIAFLKKDAKLGETGGKGRKGSVRGVQNGSYATIERIERHMLGRGATLTVRMDDGRKFSFDTGKSVEYVPLKFRGKNPLAMFRIREYDHIDHAYAITVHKSQGQTVEKCFVKASDRMTDREWGYVAMSRSKGETFLYATRDQEDALAENLSRSRMKGTTLDYEVVDKSLFDDGRKGLDLDALMAKDAEGRYDRKIETVIQAVSWGDGGDVRRLLDADPERARAEISRADDKGNTPLHLACYKRNPSAVAALIEGGAAIDAGNRMGITPLMDAVRSRDAESVALLIKAGADPFRVSKTGDSPFRFASDLERKSQTVVESATARIDELRRQIAATADEKGKEAISTELQTVEAARHNAGKDGVVARDMLAVIGKDREIPLEKAVGWRSNSVIRDILADSSKRGQVAKRTEDGKSVLHVAAATKNAWAVKALIAAGADPKAQDGNGTSVLMTAIRSKSVECVKALLDAGADPRAKDAKGNDAIRIAHGAMKQAFLGKGGQETAKAILELVDPATAKREVPVAVPAEPKAPSRDKGLEM